MRQTNKSNRTTDEKKLNFIKEHYTNSDKPMSIKQLAKALDTNVNSLNNFIWRHDLGRRKPNQIKDKYKLIYNDYLLGMRQKDIAKKYNIGQANVSYIVLKMKREKPFD